MKILRTITGMEFAQGTIIPWYLGRCHYDVNTDAVILAPIPLNFLIGWGYEAWWRIRRGPEGIEARLNTAQGLGFRAGLEAGKREAETTQRDVEAFLRHYAAEESRKETK